MDHLNNLILKMYYLHLFQINMMLYQQIVNQFHQVVIANLETEAGTAPGREGVLGNKLSVHIGFQIGTVPAISVAVVQNKCVFAALR